MKTRTKSKELVKVAIICSLSIGLFSSAFVGFNQLIFAAATNEPAPLPLTPAYMTAAQSLEQLTLEVEVEVETFIVPALTLIKSSYQHFHPIPSSAMSMEEAAQIGAHYIWDVFGTNINGMYMQMMFAAHASQTNTWWTGTVYVEDPDNPTQYYIVDSYGDEKFALPIYMFVINAITGGRIDISFMCPRVMPNSEGSNNHYDTGTSTLLPIDVNNRLSARMALLETGWFDMDINEQLAFAGLSEEAVKIYTQTAARLAKAQFNISGVSDVQLAGLSANGMTGNIVELAALNFTAIDNTGREAFISIPPTDVRGMIDISTQHNDFIPGFFYDGPGGRG
ncbi:MAG: hypothetical protein FWE24_02345 [Defluviitaleaceae bacterium]|nr:hypothetical protein [Defluviitaleaceae bacterium]